MLSDLDKIKEILFGHEKKALDAITRRLETPESRTADVADVLPDAISLSNRQNLRLQRALREPLEKTMTDAMHAEPHKFADALFPVIGPAIRKAISEALRSLVQSINRAVDTSLSPTARFKAWRAGVPLGEWVLRRSLVFRVDEVYLIDPRSGLLIEHAHHPDAGEKDEDAVSAMLTAIQDFVRDSFSDDESALGSAQVGEFTVWLSHGPYAMLAAVIRGTPPGGIRSVFDATIERLHLQHGTALKRYKGGRLPHVEEELEPCLRLQLRDDAQRRRRGLSWPVTVLLLVLAGVLAFLWYGGYKRDQVMQAWRASLEAAPGLVVTRVDRSWGHYSARGLRDPLAPDPAALAADTGIEPADLSIDFRSFQSLEPAMIQARVAKVLNPPAGVTLTLDGGVLKASGAAPADWRQRFELVGPAMAGIERIDGSELTTGDAELFARVRAATAPPTTVELRVEDGIALMQGMAPQAWIVGLPNALADIDGLRGNDLRGLQSIELDEMHRLALAIDGHEVSFTAALLLSEPQQRALQSLALKMLEFGRNAAALGVTPAFTLTGYTDGSGAAATNRGLRTRRATTVRQWLMGEGVDRDWLFVRIGPDEIRSGDPDPSLRIVRVRVDKRVLIENDATK